jgi:ribosomal protein L12E/L44/L45/RPP1/RPP2
LFAATTSSVCVALSFTSHFCQIVKEACALPTVAYATCYTNLFAKIAALEAANVADVAKATKAAKAAKAAKEEEEEEEEEKEYKDKEIKDCT